jgi:septum formation protein
MKELGLPFRVVETGHSDELYPNHLSEGAIALYLAEHKSEAYVEKLEEKQILLTADTIVWYQGVELGKPSDREEALDMISSLSGNTHQVYTGVCLRSAQSMRSFFACTDVSFSVLHKEEVEHYVEQYKPYDKAGAYGIQEWIGYIAVERIVGSYFNVMGLPVQRVYSELKSFISDLS